MSPEILSTWLLVMLPLSISPGPANLLFAASGSMFGIRATLPFWIGTNSVCLLQTLAIGVGLGWLLEAFPGLMISMRYLGILFLLYLAIRFFRITVNDQQQIKPLRLLDGVIIEAGNIKYMMIPMVMFSQFYDAGSDDFGQILMLTLALATLTMCSNLIWVLAGYQLSELIANERIRRYQSWLFGGLLLATAVWLTIG